LDTLGRKDKAQRAWGFLLFNPQVRFRREQALPSQMNTKIPHHLFLLVLFFVVFFFVFCLWRRAS